MPIILLDNIQQLAAINLLVDPGHIAGPVVIPNAVKVMPVWSLTNGKTARNVLYVTVAPGFVPTATIAETIRAAMSSGALWTAVAAFIAPTTTLTRVELQDVRTANNPAVASTGTAVPGTAATGAMPDEVALCVTLRTARTGQANRGRMYIPGFAAGAMAAGGVVAPSLVSAARSWVANFGGIFSAQTMTWVIGQPARAAYTGKTGTQHPARSARTEPVINVEVRDNHWDSQRRRGLK